MVAEADLELTELDALYPKRQLADDKTNALKGMAVRFTNQVTGGALSSLSEIEGPEQDFALFVWAHLVELRSGEEGSESQSGGSVTYNRNPGELQASLSETRYGRMARGYLRNEQSIGVVKGSSSYSG